MSIKQMIHSNLVKTNLKAKTKEEAIDELSNLLASAGKISDEKTFISEVMKREELMSTAFEGGIVMPHAKTSAVKEACIAIGISKSGIDCGSSDGELSKLFFVIAMPESANNLHVQALSEITGKLLDEDLKRELLNANDASYVIEILSKKENTKKVSKDRRYLIGVTGCPVGVAHTYLAAKALKKCAHEMGVEIKVETNGSVGVEDSPTKAEIKKAIGIIVACDKQVELDRFDGKRVVFSGVKAAIDNPKALVNKALEESAPIYSSTNKDSGTFKGQGNEKSGLYKYLMNGVSYMIPFVVIGGLLIALSLAIGGKPTPAGLQIPEGSFWNQILNVGVVGFKLMIPILAGYIAYAIGDRPAIAPGMIGGWIANDGSFYGASAGTGFIGAIIAGFAVGYLVKWIKRWKFPKSLQPLVPIMIIPIIGSLSIAALFIFVIGAPIASLMDGLVNMLQSLSSGSLIVIGLVIGLMQGFDMGGPFGKVAFMFSVGLIATGQTQFMGAQACAIPVAPLGMALATFVGKKMKIFTEEETANGKAAFAMGLVGISEGAIPFAASDPLVIIPANMIGSAVACILGFMFGITNNVAHGGPIVALLGAINKPIMALLAMIVGSIVTAAITIIAKKALKQKRDKKALAA